MNEYKELTKLKHDTAQLKLETQTMQDELKRRREPLEQRIKELEAQWALENAELIEEEANFLELTNTKEAELRAKTVEAYKANPESKTLADGIGVRVTTNYVIDTEQAITWAIEHNMPNLLTIKTPAFKKQAKLVELDFAVPNESISAVIRY